MDQVDVEPGEDPIKLRAFLKGMKLEKHIAAMEAAGYDDVEDFKSFTTESLERMRAALAKQEIPDGHIDKIARQVQNMMSQDAGASPAPVEKKRRYIASLSHEAGPHVTLHFRFRSRPRSCPAHTGPSSGR